MSGFFYCNLSFFDVILRQKYQAMAYSSKNIIQLLYDTLEHFWGYQEFRASQKDIIFSILEGKDTFALLPTGGGKSLCYQLPALVLEGTCLVVSPLLALMKDQVYQLKCKGIEAEYLSAELDDFETESIYQRCKEGITKLLFVSPERLKNTTFVSTIQDIKLSFLAVDEAHCISEWGQDFRPSYQNIQHFRRNWDQHLPVLALTATATPKVLDDITKKLGLRHPHIFQKSFQRDNISIYTESTSDKYQRLFHLLKNNQSSGIVYTNTRREAEQLADYLKNNGIQNVDYYHAGLSLKEKNFKQTQWLHASNRVLISTNAFGMGIDKDNVRFVIHFSPPNSIENYYQEIGRAGRDGQPSYALLMWNTQELTNLDQFLSQQIPNKKTFKTCVSYLYSMFQIADYDQPEKVFQFHIKHWQRLTKMPLATLKTILNFLHNQEIIYYNALKSKSSIELKIPLVDVEGLPKSDAYFIELMLRNLSGFSSHKTYFDTERLAQKIGTKPEFLKEKFNDLEHKGYLEFIDGALSSIKFLIPRDDRSFSHHWWELFLEIQKNKVQKWEELKFFIKHQDRCKMKLILAYFGEQNTKDCGQCSNCKAKSNHSKSLQDSPILSVLAKKPCTLEQISAEIPYFAKDKLLEQMVYLLDSGHIKMLNYKTYTINT